MGNKWLTADFEVVTVDERRAIMEHRQGQARVLALDLSGAVRLEMIEIPAGSFLMGAPQTEVGWRENEIPQHHVSVAGFLLGRVPVTQAQWRAVMNGLPPIESEFRGDDLPAVNVWLEEALVFCARLLRILVKMNADSGGR